MTPPAHPRRNARWARLLLAVMMMAVAAVVLANRWVDRSTGPRVWSAPEELPECRVGLVLGCSPRLRSGLTNPFFENRLQAAAALWRLGKCRALLLSGDNHVRTYDEPTAMQRRLLELGVPATAMTLDYAGFSTFDSVVRAREVFGLEDVCVITQADHARRALFIADRVGIRATGFAAEGVGLRMGLRTRWREYLAKTRTVLDLTVLQRRPHFLGPRIEISDAGRGSGPAGGGGSEPVSER